MATKRVFIRHDRTVRIAYELSELGDQLIIQPDTILVTVSAEGPCMTLDHLIDTYNKYKALQPVFFRYEREVTKILNGGE